MNARIFLLAPLLGLAACDGGTQGSGVTDADTVPDERAVAAGAVSPEETAAGTPGAGQGAPITRIPAGLQGRWGLTAADCEPDRPDAKGLLTITADKLEFYESVGTLGQIDEVSRDRVRAVFDFTGEGMTWRRDVALEVQDEGSTLIRRESGADAAPGPNRYTRCA